MIATYFTLRPLLATTAATERRNLGNQPVATVTAVAAIHLQLSPQDDDIRRARFLFCMSYDPSSRVNGQEGTAGTASNCCIRPLRR
ncbi:hypothetical protein KC332_g69 [Hortaea werneckii]|nr:hypothetical protein KC332_g69 [Hortaea werneckii]